MKNMEAVWHYISNVAAWAVTFGQRKVDSGKSYL